LDRRGRSSQSAGRGQDRQDRRQSGDGPRPFRHAAVVERAIVLHPHRYTAQARLAVWIVNAGKEFFLEEQLSLRRWMPSRVRSFGREFPPLRPSKGLGSRIATLPTKFDGGAQRLIGYVFTRPFDGLKARARRTSTARPSPSAIAATQSSGPTSAATKIRTAARSSRATTTYSAGSAIPL
jgi:hypothetical protein